MGAVRNRHTRRAIRAYQERTGVDERYLVDVPPPVTNTPRLRRFDDVMVEKAEFETAYAEYVEAQKERLARGELAVVGVLSERDYLGALIRAAIEYEKLARARRKAEAEAKGRLVEPVAVMPAELRRPPVKV